MAGGKLWLQQNCGVSVGTAQGIAMPMTEFLTLHSPGCTAIWEVVPAGAPLWRYWGPRLPDGVTPGSALAATRTMPSFAPDGDCPLSILPGVGMGWFGQSALLAHRGGADWSFLVTDCSVERPDAATVRFALNDAVAQIAVTVTARLDPDSDVLSLSTTLSNVGDAVLDVQWLAAGVLPLPCDATQVRSYGGRHNREFVAQNDHLGRSLWRRENRRGLTSHDCVPGAVVSCDDGSAYGVQLAWSGNHVQSIELCDDGRRQWQMGEWLAPGEVRLAPGASVEAPELLATCSAEGANGVAWAFHRAIRQRIDWPGGKMRPRPVHINTWEAVYFDHDLGELKELATSAAELGVERFVLDDGWFAGRDDDTSSLGDWRVDARKYPDGLGPLAAHVTTLGMAFGLWVEPEMVNPDSDMFRAHPDWALQIADRPLLTARNQLALDMDREEVRNHLFGQVAALLETLPISYLKWDHNRALTHAGDRPKFRRQVNGTYALMARLRDAFPDVEIEACAGGGGRIDAGIIRHTHRFWTSDNIDAFSRVGIQRGFLQFMPPELMGAHVGASPAHSSGRMQSMAFRSGVALLGHFGVELDVRTVEGGEREELRGAIARYKQLRDRLHSGRTWLGECEDAVVWQAVGSVEAFILIVTRTDMSAQAHPPQLRLLMLDPARRYRLSREGKPPVEADGAWLIAMGFALPRMPAQAVRIYEVVAL